MAYLVCKSCNDRLGHDVDAQWQHDPSVKLAVQNLAPKIPTVAARVGRRGSSHAVSQIGHEHRGAVKNGVFEVEHSADMFLTSAASKRLRPMMKKAGFADAEIAEAIQRFESAPNDVDIRIAPQLPAFRKRTANIERITPDLNGPLVDDLPPVVRQNPIRLDVSGCEGW